MLNFSPYAVAESEPPTWMPGENYAAAAFIGAAILLVFDINVGIWRAFRQRTGMYYWALKLGSIGCLIDAIGVILKFMTPGSTRYWQAYTIILLIGWSAYAPAQLFVLYSRLHLVNDNRRVQRWVLIMVWSTYVLLIAPTWVVVWPAWDTDPKVSSVWSPRDAIVERYNQIGFTLVECTLSAVYIWSLLGLLNLKSSIRQRRVMCDLIYVNLIIVSLDIVVVVLTYMNLTGISHPIQTFSYTLKLKLEFVVLNQLMAVAVRGSRRPRFEEMRYRQPSTRDEFSADRNPWDANTPAKTPQQRNQRKSHEKDSRAHSVQLTVPSPSLSRQQHQYPSENATPESRPQRHAAPHSTATDILYNDMKPHRDGYGASHSPPSAADDASLNNDNDDGTGESLRRLDSAPEAKPSQHSRHQRFRDSLRSAAKKKKKNESKSPGRQSQEQKKSINGYLTRRVPKNGKNLEEDGYEDEEVGVHMWENRKGSLVMEVPWFRSRVEAEG